MSDPANHGTIFLFNMVYLSYQFVVEWFVDGLIHLSVILQLLRQLSLRIEID